MLSILRPRQNSVADDRGSGCDEWQIPRVAVVHVRRPDSGEGERASKGARNRSRCTPRSSFRIFEGQEGIRVLRSSRPIASRLPPAFNQPAMAGTPARRASAAPGPNDEHLVGREARTVVLAPAKPDGFRCRLPAGSPA